MATTYAGYTGHTGEGPDRKPQPHRFAEVKVPTAGGSGRFQALEKIGQGYLDPTPKQPKPKPIDPAK